MTSQLAGFLAFLAGAAPLSRFLSEFMHSAPCENDHGPQHSFQPRMILCDRLVLACRSCSLVAADLARSTRHTSTIGAFRATQTSPVRASCHQLDVSDLTLQFALADKMSPTTLQSPRANIFRATHAHMRSRLLSETSLGSAEESQEVGISSLTDVVPSTSSVAMQIPPTLVRR